jgi:GTPase SAR1 family protein
VSGPADKVAELLDLADEATAGSPLAAEVAELRLRLDGPLRVAIAGRVKAGKSTLLNALIGERLAATDAGECTRIVTWYRDGVSYEVSAIDPTGQPHELVFRRQDGILDIELGDRTAEGTARLEVTWPSRALQTVTLIDTPGLASIDDTNSMRTREFLAMGEDRPSDADAVIYLMRHLHRRDAEFLGSFLDRTVSATSPVNAVAVLSRADEIGSGRLDAMDSSHHIARRYQTDHDVQALCAAVVPVAGLLAETGLTLREEEAAALRTIAATPDDVLEPMLWSTDGFCEPGSSDITVELRRSLLLRLGLFGLRLVIGEIRAERATTAADLARVLVATSGLEELRRVIDELFLPRSQVLKARSTLTGLRTVARRLSELDAAAGRRLASEVERVESSIPEFGQLRLVHLVRTGTVAFSPDQTAELELITTPTATDAVRLGLDPGAERSDLQRAALGSVERWRTLAANPLNDPAVTEVCESMARTYEALYVEVSADNGS